MTDNIPTLKEFAEKISGLEYPAHELTTKFSQEAERLGYFIIYGMSDDCLEIRGVISDEHGAYGGTKIKLGTKVIEAIWSPPEHPETSWLIKPDCPFEPFHIMEDGNIFCIGAVFKARDLEKQTLGMPKALTAENGAKAALMGEFSWQEESSYVDEDGYPQVSPVKRVVPWAVIKEIYAKAVEHFEKHPELVDK